MAFYLHSASYLLQDTDTYYTADHAIPGEDQILALTQQV